MATVRRRTSIEEKSRIRFSRMPNFKIWLRSIWLCRPSSFDASSLTLSPRYPKGGEAISTLRQQVDKEGEVRFLVEDRTVVANCLFG